ncbi:hypothetical protein Tco_0432257 [Tanacetum coccineum]
MSTRGAEDIGFCIVCGFGNGIFDWFCGMNFCMLGRIIGLPLSLNMHSHAHYDIAVGRCLRCSGDYDLDSFKVYVLYLCACAMRDGKVFRTSSKWGINGWKGVNTSFGRSRTQKLIRCFLATPLAKFPRNKARGKWAHGEKVTITPKKKSPKKKSSITTDDNIILDPDQALQLGLIRRQLTGVIIRDIPNVPKKKAIDQSQKLKEVPNEPKDKFAGSSKGAGTSPEVLDELKDKFADSSEGAGTSLEVLDELKGKSAVLDEEDWGSDDDETFLIDKGDIKEPKIDSVSTDDEEAKDDNDDEDDDMSIDIVETDDERIESDDDNHEMAGAAKTNADTMVEEHVDKEDEENAEKVEELKVDEEKQGDNQAEDDKVRIPISTTHKEKPICFNPRPVTLFLPTLIKQEHAAKEKMPKYSTTPYDQTTENEYKQKNILFKMMMASNSYNKHPAHKALYDALIESLFMDEDDMDRAVAEASTQMKRRHDNEGQDPPPDSEKAKKRQRTKDTGKYATAAESVQEIAHEVPMDVKEPVLDDVANNVDEPQGDGVTQTPTFYWFKQPPRPETPDPDWNTVKATDDPPKQTWFNEMVNTEKPPFTFNELMSTPIDFIAFAKNRLKLDKITISDLLGLVFNLLEGHKRSVDISKPLPLQDKEGRLVIPVEFFFNNDLEYLKAGNTKKKYSSSITKTPAVSVKVKMRLGYGYLEEIVVRRADQKLYKFKEGDFSRLHLNDIEYMLLLLNQQKLFNLDGDILIDLKVALNMFTRRIVVQKRIEDCKRLMRTDELYKFSDGTLISVCDTLHHRLLNFMLGLNNEMPRRKITDKDKRGTNIMVNLIDKQVLDRRIMKRLEVLVGGRKTDTDRRLLQRIV